MDATEEIPPVMNIAAESGPSVEEPPAFVRMPFPVEVLPSVLRKFVEDASQALGVPPEVVAAPAIATCAAAIGNTVRVRISPTWMEPCVLWMVTLLESGSLKTPAYNLAVNPLRKQQEELEHAYQHELETYQRAVTAYEADHAQWLKTSREGKPPEGGPPRKPIAPRAKDLFTSDSTVEALALLFSNNPRGLALMRDELTAFFGSFGAYKGGRGADEATYLEFYNAGCVKLNRASGKRVFVNSAALTIFGTCQPSVFLRVIGADDVSGRNQIDNGLAARFLIAAPLMPPKRWRSPQTINDVDYHAMISGLLAIPLVRDSEDHPASTIIDLSPPAVKVFAQFVNEHGLKTSKIENAALRYHFAKLEAAAARLALICHLCKATSNEPDDGPGVSAEETMAGIKLARWFGREAMRVYAFYENEHQKEMHDLLKLVRGHGGQITLREMGNARRKWRDSSAAELALRSLVRIGYGTLVLDDHGGVGRPCLRFHLTEVVSHAPD